MIPVPNGARVWLAAGHTDMRRGFDGLALMVQETLRRDPHGGHLFVFRGRRGGLIKVLWHDGQGLCLFSKRLERGRFSFERRKPARRPLPAHLPRERIKETDFWLRDRGSSRERLRAIARAVEVTLSQICRCLRASVHVGEVVPTSEHQRLMPEGSKDQQEQCSNASHCNQDHWCLHFILG